MTNSGIAQPAKSGGIWGAGHPMSAVLDQAMLDEPGLTLMCTFQRSWRVDKFGADRVMRMPIAENAMLGMAVGMALTGRRVVIDVARVAFLYSAMDPLVNEATKWRYSTNGQFSVPLIIRAVTQGGEYLGSQHEHLPHAALSQIPGLVVAVPASPNSAAGLLATALAYPDPVIILESPQLFMPGWADLPEPELTANPIPFGVARQVRDGADLTLVGIGNTVALCLRVAGMLATRGVDCQVVDLRTAAPLDRDGVAALAARTSGVVLVDEAPSACSLMRDLGFHLICSGSVPPDRVRTVSGALCPMPASPILQRELLPDEESVVRAVEALADAGARSAGLMAHALAGGRADGDHSRQAEQ